MNDIYYPIDNAINKPFHWIVPHRYYIMPPYLIIVQYSIEQIPRIINDTNKPE